jgi:predicted NBD/HSP70 family sugar kinase
MHPSRRTRHVKVVSINSKVGRDINRSVVLNSIRENQPVSRAGIAELTKLNKSTVSSIVAGLLQENLIAEERNGRHRVGRTPIHLHIKTSGLAVGAVYIDSVKTSIAIVDVGGTIRSSEDIKTEPQRPLEFLARCLNALDTQRQRLHLPSLHGIGVTFAGIVDPLRERVVYAPNLGWEQLDLGATLRAHAPQVKFVAIENDAKASALAELWFGRREGQQPGSFVFLSVGAGIGTGIVVDNHILSGSTHAAGEFGHMTIVEGGEPCTCGNRGCWEAYASNRATARWYAQAKGRSAEEADPPRMLDLLALAHTGDVAARDALLKSAHYVGLGIANILRAFDPELVVIGGPITRAWSLIEPEIHQSIRQTGFFTTERNTRIEPTALSANPPLLGAAALSIRRIFTDVRFAR